MNIKNLIPHSGEMILVTRVLDFGDDFIIVQSDLKKHCVFAENNIFQTYKCLEIMAQSLGVLRGIAKNSDGNRLGFLLGARKFNIFVPQIALPCSLTTKAHLQMQDSNGLGIYQASAHLGEILLCSANITILNPSNEFLEKMELE